MENNQKRLFLNMAYYSLIGITILFCTTFVFRVIYSAMPLYIKIIYYVWTGALVLTIIYDLICTYNRGMKYISGLILYILAILSIIMAIDVFFMQGISIKTITNIEFTYFINMALSFIPIKLAIFAYLFGEKLINFND